MAIGNATACKTLAEALEQSDFVTLHVPATPATRNMIGAKELAAMRRGAGGLFHPGGRCCAPAVSAAHCDPHLFNNSSGESPCASRICASGHSVRGRWLILTAAAALHSGGCISGSAASCALL